jgi:tRNA 2-thiouridine synthesizing protein D
MQFSLLVLGSPYSSQSTATALRFANAVISSGNQLYRVFFYHDGVHSANELICPPQDELHIPEQWQQLAQTSKVDLVVCVGSALKRGILDTTEADRYEKHHHNLKPEFEISGLGQLVDAAIHSDRLVTFGP